MSIDEHVIRGGLLAADEAEPLHKLAWLAEASTWLAARATQTEIFGRLTDLVVPALADWCAIDGVDDDGALRRVAVRTADPAQRELAETLSAHEPGPHSDHPARLVVATGRSRVYPDISPEVIVDPATEGDKLDLLQRVGVRSLLAVPMYARGRTLAVLTLAMTTSGRRYASADLVLLEDLARRAAMALDNARLLEESAAAEDRYRALVQRLATQHEVSRILASEQTLAAAGPEVLEVIGESLEWDIGTLWLLDVRPGRLRGEHTWGSSRTSRALRDSLARPELRRGESIPGRVWASGEPVWVAGIGEGEGDARLVEAREAGMRAAFAFPIVSGGEVLGVIEFLARSARTRDPEILAMFRSIGSQVGQFVVRRWNQDEVAFQRAMLQSLNESSIDGILVVSAEGAPLSFNGRFAELWGLPSDLEPRELPEPGSLLRDKLEEPERFISRVRRLAEHPAAPDREELRLRDGRIFDSYTAPLQGSDASLYGRAWYFRDITEQKRAEMLLAETSRRSAFLAEASSALVASLDYTLTLRALAELCVTHLADWCIVDLLDPDGRVVRLTVAYSDPAVSAVAETVMTAVPQGSDAPRGIVAVLREGRSQVVSRLEDAAGDLHPSEQEVLLRTGARSTMCVPLIARGRTLGAATFIRTTGEPYGADDVALAEDLGRRAGLAVDNARLYAERSYVARTLQESLLPPHLPVLERLEVAWRYIAAGESVEVGGDFYDLFDTGGDDYAVVIGDVCGKGADAAALTALARYTIRAAGMQVRKPSRVLAMLNEAIIRQRNDDRFCTVAYARLRRTSRGVHRLTVSSGGHPLPYVIRATGQVHTVGRPGSLLGILPDVQLNDEVLTLEPGDVVVLYTDGVTEARAPGGEQFGEERLRELLRGFVGSEASAVVERVTEHVMGYQEGAPRDDIAVVAVRVL